MLWEARVQSQVDSYQILKKWYIMAPCLTLSIISYGPVKSGLVQGNESSPSGYSV